MGSTAKFIAKLILIGFFSVCLYFGGVHPLVVVFLSVITADLWILNGEIES